MATGEGGTEAIGRVSAVRGVERKSNRLTTAASLLLAALSVALLVTSLMYGNGPAKAGGSPSTRLAELAQVRGELSVSPPSTSPPSTQLQGQPTEVPEKELDGDATAKLQVHSTAEGRRVAEGHTEMLVGEGDDLRLPSDMSGWKKFSEPAAGIFTGHKHGRKGGRLTFGRGTYYNVFDPDPNQSDCSPGEFGTSNTCRPCTMGYWCPGGYKKHKCPPQSTSLEGATKLGDCYCKPGMFGIKPVAKGQVLTCSVCPKNSFCPGGAAVNPCPKHTSSKEGSFSCTCNKGYFGTDMNKCTACPKGSWCPGAEKPPVACPPSTTSRGATGDVSGCKCMSGLFQMGGTKPGQVPQCFTCPRGMYCPGGRVKVLCPSKSNSPSGSKRIEDCVCAPGYMGEAADSCQSCPKNSYCVGGGRKSRKCPAKTYTVRRASHRLVDCLCGPGTYGIHPRSCITCPKNSYCRGGSSITRCPRRSISGRGATRCRCAAGYYGTDPSKCSLCPRNRFCPGGASVRRCPSHTASKPGGKHENDCKCLPGYTLVGSTCRKCPKGSYCPTIGGKPRKCPPRSSSEEGAKDARDCDCIKGYSQWNKGTRYGKSRNGPRCFACSPGFWCPGGQRPSVCPRDSTSDRGSTARGDCTCKAGYYGASGRCSTCSTGFFCDGGKARTSCPLNATSRRGAKKASDCHCAVGFHGKATDCKRCPAGFFCTKGKVRKCPSRSTSRLGDKQCSCAAGYYGSNPRRCRKCRPGYFCEGGAARLKCPRYSTSKAGATGVSQCQCRKGYRVITSGGKMECRACPEGSYCPGNGKIRSCPSRKTSALGAHRRSMCGCVAGYRDSDRVPGSNYVWVFEGKFGVKKAGPYHVCTRSDDGSLLSVDGRGVVNNDGLHGARTRCGRVVLGKGLHTVKTTGFQRHGGVTMQVLYSGPDTYGRRKHLRVADKKRERYGRGRWDMTIYRSKRSLKMTPSDAELKGSRFVLVGKGSVHRVHFRRLNDFRRFIRGTCHLCAPGHFCPGGFRSRYRRRRYRGVPYARQLRCPHRSWSIKLGSKNRKECDQCRPGYYGPGLRKCKSCRRGFYCPGGAEQRPCPEGSTSHGRARDINKCFCKARYKKKAAGGPNHQCVKCPRGSYCPRAGGRYIRKCPVGATSPSGSMRWSACKCPAGQYRHGHSRCYNCQKRYYCKGDNRRRRCPAYAVSNPRSDSVEDCVCPSLKHRYPRRYSKTTTSCMKYSCRKTTLCRVQRWCDGDSLCRGFTFPEGVRVGMGCKIRGLSKCVSDRRSGDSTLYLKRKQIPDSVHLMRRLRIKVPQCSRSGPQITFERRCYGRDRHAGSLPVGDWSVVHWNRCDNDAGLCEIRHCRIHSGATQQIKNIPEGFTVDLYSRRRFKGYKATLRGPIGRRCLQHVRDRRRRRFTNRLQSVKIRKQPGFVPIKYAGWCSMWYWNPLGRSGIRHFPKVAHLFPQVAKVVQRVDFRHDSEFIAVVGSGHFDRVAITFKGTLRIRKEGRYRICTNSDDGSHIHLDGRAFVSSPGLHPPRKRCRTRNLSKGDHSVFMKFFENGGGAYMRATYSGPDTGGVERDMRSVGHGGSCVAPKAECKCGSGWCSEFFFDPNGHRQVRNYPNVHKLNGQAAKVVSKINFRNDRALQRFLGASRKKSGFDRVAVRFNGILRIRKGGRYRLCTSSDDGSRLLIDGRMAVDNGGLHGTRKRCSHKYLSAGNHVAVVDFFENGGGASIKVFYRGPDTRGRERLMPSVWHNPKKCGAVGSSGGKRPSKPRGPAAPVCKGSDARAYILQDASKVDIKRESEYMRKPLVSVQRGLRGSRTLRGFIGRMRDSRTSFVVIPEQEKGRVLSSLSSADRRTMKKYVVNGGILVVAYAGNSGEVAMLNTVFGWSLKYQRCGSTRLDSGAAGTCWESMCKGKRCAKLPSLNAIRCVRKDSVSRLPRSKVIYSSGNAASVFEVKVGKGKVVGLAPDWYATTHDWNNVLKAATYK